MPSQEKLDKEHVHVGVRLVDHVHGDLGHKDLVPVDLVDGEPGDGGPLQEQEQEQEQEQDSKQRKEKYRSCYQSEPLQ